MSLKFPFLLFQELSREIKSIYGRFPDKFADYWLSKFPKLLIHSWLSMHCVKNEPTFLKHYHKDYEFIEVSSSTHFYTMYILWWKRNIFKINIVNKAFAHNQYPGKLLPTLFCILVSISNEGERKFLIWWLKMDKFYFYHFVIVHFCVLFKRENIFGVDFGSLLCT